MDVVSFVCVNYNNSQYTAKFCESLLAQSGRDDSFRIRCLVVDNSTDASDSAHLRDICQKYSWVNYIHSGSNLGYFGGLSRGLAERPQADSRFVVICNNDLEFERSFCRALLALPADAKTFALCPDIVTHDGKHQNPHLLESLSAFRLLQFDLFFSHFYIACILLHLRRWLMKLGFFKRPPFTERREVHMGLGACYVLTRNYFSHFDNLDCPVFLYGEEVFMSAQIHSRGGILVYEPQLKVTHAESASVSRIPKRMRYEYERKSYPLYRNLETFSGRARGGR